MHVFGRGGGPWVRPCSRFTGVPLLAALVTGCYTYQPLQTPEPEVGRRVSVQLTSDGAQALSAQIGPNILHVEGNVVSVDSNAVALAVRQVQDFRGVQSDWTGERVAVPRRSVAGMQERRLSIGATGMMGGLAVLAVVVLYDALGGGGLLEGNTGSGGGAGQ